MKKNPTYRSLGDHTETVQVEYDPKVITYREMLAIFWENHEPTIRSWSRQYKSAIFYHSEAQKQQAEETRNRLSSRLNKPVVTEILPYSGFTLAEDYHQKHSMRLFPEIMEEFSRIYPAGDNFVSSTAVARVNGYLGGHGTCEDLQAELDQLGLSPGGSRILLRRVCGSQATASCPIKK